MPERFRAVPLGCSADIDIERTFWSDCRMAAVVPESDAATAGLNLVSKKGSPDHRMWYFCRFQTCHESVHAPVTREMARGFAGSRTGLGIGSHADDERAEAAEGRNSLLN